MTLTVNPVGAVNDKDVVKLVNMFDITVELYLLIFSVVVSVKYTNAPILKLFEPSLKKKIN